MTPAISDARTHLIDTIRRHKRAEVSLEVLYAAADAYIAAIQAHAKATGRKFPIPRRGYLIRALA